MKRNEINILEMLKNSKISQTFSQGETIFEKGSDGDKMYIILEGEVEVNVDGYVVGKLIEGQVLGEIALVEKRPRSATAVSKTDTKLVPIDKETFLFIVKEDPNFALFVMKDLSHKIRDLNKRLSD